MEIKHIEWELAEIDPQKLQMLKFVETEYN